MKILFDQGTPRPLRRHLIGHSVDTTFQLGWSRLSNGELLDRAEEQGYELLVTTDQQIRHQQNLGGRKLAVLVLSTTSWPDILPRADDILAVVNEIGAGDFREFPVTW